MIQLTLLIEVTGKVHYNNSDVIVHHYTLYIVSSLYKSDTIASNMRQQGAATAGIQLRVLSAGGRSFPICHL